MFGNWWENIIFAGELYNIKGMERKESYKKDIESRIKTLYIISILQGVAIIWLAIPSLSKGLCKLLLRIIGQ